MKKYFSALFTPLVILLVYGQVGIGTGSPQQMLHLGGGSTALSTSLPGANLVTPTIRIEGLSRTNKPLIHTATNSVQPVYTNSNGDLKIIKGVNVIYDTPFSGSLFASNIVLNLTPSPRGVYYTNLSSSISFTLDNASIVNFAATIPVIVSNQSNALINSGDVRLYGLELNFTSTPAGSGIATGQFVDNKTAYTDFSSTGLDTLATQRLNISTEIRLPAGTYTVLLRGYGGANTNAPFRLTFVGGDAARSRLMIYARPI